MRYLIQLDRRGACDCVFYDCANGDFIKFIETYGFIEAKGSFSDISFLMPAWKVCGVNLSVGYANEHSVSEILHINVLFRTIDKVKKMLQETKIPKFDYYEAPSALTDYFAEMNPSYGYEMDLGKKCICCDSYFFDFELIPIKGYRSKKTKYCCPDCIVDHVNWCDNCGHAYEIGDPEEDMDLCTDCVEVLTSGKDD